MLIESDASHQPLAIVGRDPRASGEMLEAAVVAGLTSAGANVVRVGVLPTPAVAYLVGQAHADLGVMLSASHNPMPDNGIKLFAAGGQKLPDEIEDQIEAAVADGHGLVGRPTGAGIGRVHDLLDGAEHYIKHLVAATPHRLDGIRVVVDCANGAASEVGPAAYEEAGAEVIAIHAEPDGLNINDDCGSTHIEVVRDAVLAEGADLGIAHDGDADRCLAVTAAGDIVDGDQIMAILALAMRDAGTLTDNTLVATVMSNLGLRLAMQRAEHPADRGQGRRPVRAGGTAGRVARARRRAERAHRAAGVRDHRRRRAHRAAVDGADRLVRQVAGRPRRGAAQAAPGADQRPGRPTGPKAPRRRPCRRRWPWPRTSWARPAGCCCARPAPSHSSG